MLASLREAMTVDCRGLQCPAPILRLSEAVRQRRGQGGTLTVLATDVDFPVDLEAWCRTTKAKVEKIEREPDGVIRAEVRLADPAAPDSMVFHATVPTPTVANPSSAVPVIPSPPHRPAIAGSTMPSPRDERPSPTPAGRRETFREGRPAPPPVGRRETFREGWLSRAPSHAPKSPAPPPSDGEVIDLQGVPIGSALRMLNAAASSAPGGLAYVVSDQPGFDKRLVAWATAMDVALESMETSAGGVRATVRFSTDVSSPNALPLGVSITPEGTRRASTGALPAPAASVVPARAASVAPAPSAAIAPVAEEKKTCTLLVLRNDLKALLAALMVANASAAQGMSVDVYFAFWGIHLLRGRSSRPDRSEPPGLLQRMLLWLVPAGTKQRLGKLHMGGVGTRILLRLMRKKNVLALDGLVTAAAEQGVRFRVCSMSMGLMGLRESDIVDLPNVDFAGVTSFAEAAARSSASFVF